MYRCWLHTHCVYIRNDAIMYMKKRDAAVKKQSNEHRSRTAAHFQLVVVISGREMSAMFGRVTFFLSLRVDVLSHVGCDHSCFHLLFINNI